MNGWSTEREPEKPKTVKGRNELLRTRALNHAARARTLSVTLHDAFGDKFPAASVLGTAACLLEDLAAALKP